MLKHQNEIQVSTTITPDQEQAKSYVELLTMDKMLGIGLDHIRVGYCFGNQMAEKTSMMVVNRSIVCNLRSLVPEEILATLKALQQTPIYTHLHAVGSKTLKLWGAVCIAAVFEFLGAFFLGGNVTKTIAGSIAKPATFQYYPALFMFGR